MGYLGIKRETEQPTPLGTVWNAIGGWRPQEFGLFEQATAAGFSLELHGFDPTSLVVTSPRNSSVIGQITKGVAEIL